jgi:hypothetical protein
MAMNMHGTAAERYKLILVDCNFLSRATVLCNSTKGRVYFLMSVVKTTPVTVESEIYK